MDAPPRLKRPLPDGMNPRGARKTAKSERRRAPTEAFWLFSEKILEKPCSEGMRCTASLLGGAFFCARTARTARPTGSIVRSPGKNRPPEPASCLHTPPGFTRLLAPQFIASAPCSYPSFPLGFTLAGPHAPHAPSIPHLSLTLSDRFGGTLPPSACGRTLAVKPPRCLREPARSGY